MNQSKDEIVKEYRGIGDLVTYSREKGIVRALEEDINLTPYWLLPLTLPVLLFISAYRSIKNQREDEIKQTKPKYGRNTIPPETWH